MRRDVHETWMQSAKQMCTRVTYNAQSALAVSAWDARWMCGVPPGPCVPPRGTLNVPFYGNGDENQNRVATIYQPAFCPIATTACSVPHMGMAPHTGVA